MIEAITTGFTTVLGWMGSFADALLTTDGALNAFLPIIGVGIAVSVLFLGVKALRSLTWGA